MSNPRNYIGFTLDVRALVCVLAQDPKCREEIDQGLQDAALPLTSALGSANLTPGEGTEDTWMTLFPATVKGKISGDDGLFYRNDSYNGKGDRVQMRLKKQPKDQEVHAATAPASAIDMNNPQVAALIQALAAVTQTGQVVTAPASAVADVPEDIAAQVGLINL